MKKFLEEKGFVECEGGIFVWENNDLVKMEVIEVKNGYLLKVEYFDRDGEMEYCDVFNNKELLKKEIEEVLL